jgi:histidinol-phosphate phosphatase family protein
VRFVGLDLAWSPRNRSGGVVLSADGQVLQATGDLGDDDQVLDFVQEAVPRDQPGLVAIDAPLAVPNERGGRPCDKQVAAVFARFDAGPYPANRRNLARYGGLRAEALSQRLQTLGFRHSPYVEQHAAARQVSEVFPHPATVSLFGLERILNYKARPGRDYPFRWRELARLRDHLIALAQADPPLHLPAEIADLPIEGQRGRAFKRTEDLLDAIVCAYSALYAWRHGPRGYAVYGPQGIGSPPDEGHILVPMTPAAWERIKQPRLLLLDRDGTLNYAPDHRPPNHPNEVEMLPGVGAKLHHYASLGWRLVVVTNQGGVAFGYLNEKQAQAIHQAVLDALPVEIDTSYLCPHHPQGTIPRYAVECPNRKPAPGAILDALARFGANPTNCLFVGDQESDCEAARAAGVPFVWARDWVQAAP